MEECIFCKIVNGEIPTKKIFEDDDTIAFLDISPANPGHTLVISKKHYADIFESDEHMMKIIISTVKKVSDRLKKNLKMEGLNVVQNNGKIAGQVIPHIHFHLIPRTEGDGVSFEYARKNLDEKAINEIHDKILNEEPDTEDEISKIEEEMKF